MNPDTTLRTWILAVGKQYGIRKAVDYRWPDPLNRQREMYATYQIMSCVPDEIGQQNLNSKTDHTVHRRGAQKHTVVCRVDLYNSEDGMYELSAFGVAAHHSPVIRKIFSDHGVAFVEVSGVENMSTFDDEEILYHCRMTCEFTENVEISLDEINNVVDTINITLEEDGITHSTALNELTAAPDALAATGTATFTLVGP